MTKRKGKTADQLQKINTSTRAAAVVMWHLFSLLLRGWAQGWLVIQAGHYITSLNIHVMAAYGETTNLVVPEPYCPDLAQADTAMLISSKITWPLWWHPGVVNRRNDEITTRKTYFILENVRKEWKWTSGIHRLILYQGENGQFQENSSPVQPKNGFSSEMRNR